MNRQAKPISRCSSWNRSSTRACTDTSSADVGSSAISSRGLEGQRAGDADALALAARELVRVAVAQVAGQVHLVEQLLDPLARARRPWRPCVQQQRLADRLADRQPRVERRARVLEHEAHARGAPCAGPPWRCRPCSCRATSSRALDERQQPDDRPADRGLARPGLAHQADDLARPIVSVTPSTARNAGARPRLGYSMATSCEIDDERRPTGAARRRSAVAGSSTARRRRARRDDDRAEVRHRRAAAAACTGAAAR